MALKPCKECGNQISDTAKNCPQCGAKQPKRTSKLALILAGLVLASILTAILGKDNKDGHVVVEPSPEQKILASKASTMRVISEGLKDPDSAKFDFINENCGTVNSKNSFGGYVGARRFVVVGDMIDLEGHNISKEEMNILWRKNCT